MAAALAVMLVVAQASACSVFGDDTPPAPTPSAAPQPVVMALQQVLDRRAQALRRDDLGRFERTLAGPASFRRDQRAYFDAVGALPVEGLRMKVLPAEVVLSDDSYWAVVEVRMQLRGYDTAPVVVRDRYRFTPGRRAGSYRITSTTDAAWEQRNDVLPEPWDAGPVQIRRAPGVLGVFDDATVGSAARVLATVRRAIDDVALQVPYDWTRSVVVYAVQDPALLAAVAPADTGGDGGVLDAVAFEVPTDIDSRRVASTRVVLAPAALTAAPSVLARLVRHELTHVAIGDRDDRAPRWLQEGLAEWVSTRPMRPAQRLVPADAVAALATPPSSMPADDAVNGPEAATDYALGWWACEVIADRFGPYRLWDLLDAYTASGEGDDAGASVLRSVVGWTPSQLARKAARALEDTYAPAPPAPPATPTPSASPSEDPSTGPSPTPTAGPRD